MMERTDHYVIIRYNPVPDEEGWWEVTSRCGESIGWSAAPGLSVAIGEATVRFAKSEFALEGSLS